jgi:hypothetical protein
MSALKKKKKHEQYTQKCFTYSMCVWLKWTYIDVRCESWYFIKCTEENDWWVLLFYGFKSHFQQYFNYIVAVSCIGGETGVPGENHRPVASH